MYFVILHKFLFLSKTQMILLFTFHILLSSFYPENCIGNNVINNKNISIIRTSRQNKYFIHPYIKITPKYKKCLKSTK